MFFFLQPACGQGLHAGVAILERLVVVFFGHFCSRPAVCTFVRIETEEHVLYAMILCWVFMIILLEKSSISSALRSGV